MPPISGANPYYCPEMSLSEVERVLPDVAVDAAVMGRLDWVGMQDIESAVQVLGDDGSSSLVPAQVDAYVDLSLAGQRGIHMSRLYVLVDRELSAGPLTPARIRALLHAMLESHDGISHHVMLKIRYRHLLRRRALASDNSGWRSYPVAITARADGDKIDIELGFDITYSSTCPASAALSRQLIQEQFQRDFAQGDAIDHAAVVAWLGSTQGIVATPHAQRSTAKVRVKLADGVDFPLLDLIDRVEAALGTPVQTAVKRLDEQAFALCNGQNLMFCEDAARRIGSALDGDERITDYWLHAAHHESLHPHDAVSMASKGVAGGYGPNKLV